MKFKVDTNNIALCETNELNKGEYNIHICEFDFSNEYDGLVKKALFTDSFGTTYSMDIIDNKCEIPYDVLSSNGDVILGVYGYITDGDTLTKRYSPKPTKFSVENGSYLEDIDNTSKPTPTELEQLDSRVTSMETKIASGGLYKSDIVDDLTSESADKVLSANQGHILNENISKTNSTIEMLSSNVGANTSEIEDIKTNYITKAVNDLENYYLKSETDTQITSATENIAFNGYKIYDINLYVSNNGYVYSTYSQDIVQEALQNLYTNKIKPIFRMTFLGFKDCHIYVDISESEINNFLNSSSNSNSTINTNYVFYPFTETYPFAFENTYNIRLRTFQQRINYSVSDGKITISSIDFQQTETTFLPTNNRKEYIPKDDYNPATKKYVDDSITTAINSITNGDEVSY